MKRLLGVFALLLAFSGSAWAHGGGLDGYGCHNDRKHGGYHCHRGALAGQSFSSKTEMLQVLQGQQQATPKEEPAPAQEQPKKSNPITGVASVTDGDTVEIHGQRIRLQGIDAPESSQLCTVDGKDYRCGQQAALALADKIGRQAITCEPETTDKYGRTVAVCSLGGVDLNRWMVQQGHALAYRQYSARYVTDEEAARAAKLGIWKGAFEEPWEWRKNRKH